MRGRKGVVKMENFVRKVDVERFLVSQFDSEKLAELICEMCSNKEMAAFIVGFSGRRITEAMHKLGFLSQELEVADRSEAVR